MMFLGFLRDFRASILDNRGAETIGLPGSQHDEDIMARPAIRTAFLAAALSLLTPGLAAADDNLKIAIGQRGGWEQSVCELGQDKGFFKKHGLTLDVLYTQGSAETLQSVISNSVDIGIGLGTHALLGAYLKGAPIRGVGASFTSADEQFYYVVADSPVKTMKDAGGKSIAISTNGWLGFNPGTDSAASNSTPSTPSRNWPAMHSRLPPG